MTHDTFQMFFYIQDLCVNTQHLNTHTHMSKIHIFISLNFKNFIKQSIYIILILYA